MKYFNRRGTTLDDCLTTQVGMPQDVVLAVVTWAGNHFEFLPVRLKGNRGGRMYLGSAPQDIIGPKGVV